MYNLGNAHGKYILQAIEKAVQSGDAYILEGDLYNCCKRKNPKLTADEFRNDLGELLIQRQVVKTQNGCCYLLDVWQMESLAAKLIAEILECNYVMNPLKDERLEKCCKGLSDEQKQAVRLALSHRLSLITGGPGTGKTTLIGAIIEGCDSRYN